MEGMRKGGSGSCPSEDTEKLEMLTEPNSVAATEDWTGTISVVRQVWNSKRREWTG